jgi:hypothetical protein
MQSLRPEDIDVSIVEHGREYRRKSDGELLCTWHNKGMFNSPTDLEVIAATYNAALTEGMELGRRLLQEELRDLLGVK